MASRKSSLPVSMSVPRGIIQGPEFEAFFDAYVEAALWSSTDDKDRPLDSRFGPSDIVGAARLKMKRDAVKFFLAARDTIERAHVRTAYGRWAQAGHDFWLTRNGHGAGFWDGDWSKPEGDALTRAAKKMGEQYLHVYRKRIYVD